VLHGALLFGVAQRDRARAGESQCLRSLRAWSSRRHLRPLPSRAAVGAGNNRPQTTGARQTPGKPGPAPNSPALEARGRNQPVAGRRKRRWNPPAPAPPGRRSHGPRRPRRVIGAARRRRRRSRLAGAVSLQLKLVAAKYKRYPRWRPTTLGKASWRCAWWCAGRSGRVAPVTKTSGHEVLDRQAQEMFRSAADVPFRRCCAASSSP
jgi:hypothetical protein